MTTNQPYELPITQLKDILSALAKEHGNDHSKSANLAADGLEILVRNEAVLPQSPEYLPLRKQVLGYIAGYLKESRTRKIIEDRAVQIYDPAAA